MTQAIKTPLLDKVRVPADLRELPESDLPQLAAELRTELIDAVSNKDDEIAELIIEDKPITPAILKAAIRRLTCKIEMIPVLCGSAFKKKGVQPLVDAVIDYLPSPLDVPSATGIDPSSNNQVAIPSSDNGEFCALAFKLWTDPYVGKLVFFRVYSGTLKKGDVISTSGNTGHSFAPHLHYQLVDAGGKLLDPFESVGSSWE